MSAVFRGDLARPWLALQTIRLATQAERLAWLAEHVPALPGHGIIYTLTRRDAGLVAEWLRSRCVDVEVYTGESGERGVRHPLPGAWFGGGLLPAGGASRPGARGGARRAAER